MFKTFPIAIALMIIPPYLAASTTADARWVRGGGHSHRIHTPWGDAGLIRGGWGLGGIADRPWVGGSIIAVTPYGPYPYGPYFDFIDLDR